MTYTVLMLFREVVTGIGAFMGIGGNTLFWASSTLCARLGNV